MSGKYLSFGTWARLAKLVALLCFLLPWAAVSCSSHVAPDSEIAQLFPASDRDGGANATGLQLATGRAIVEIPAAITALPAPPGPSPGIIVAAALIALSLAAGFILKRKSGLIAAIGGSAAAVVLLCYSMLVALPPLARAWLLAWANRDFPGYERILSPDQVAQAIQVRPQYGFWLTIAALVAAIVLGGLALREARAKPGPGAD